MKNIALIFLLSLLFIISSFSTLELKSPKIKKIVIDAGHGGKDPGCHGKHTKESQVALNVALAFGKLIQENMPEVKVIFTRDSDVFIELHDRAGLANKNNADMFVSIHCNSASAHISGSETYTMGLHTSEGNLEVAKRENNVILKEDNYKDKYDGFDPNSPMAYILLANKQSAFLSQSLKFASLVEERFENDLGRNSRGVKQAGFLVLWKTVMPSALIEIGYLTNENDEKFLKNSDNQYEIANSIYTAFKKYKSNVEG
jgi:N-acetylmuramoyl-L-alanine amidase